MSYHFARTKRLIGEEGLQHLQQSSVLICGVGGVGSYVAEALARSGVGRLILIDHDTIAESNINRQIHALTSTVGQAKVEVMKRRILDINPACEVEDKQIFFDQSQAELLTGVNYVADAIDSIEAKVELIELCLTKSIPIISSMGAGNRMDPTQFKVADISKTHTCPMARKVRKLLKEKHITRGLPVVFSTEPALKPVVDPEPLTGGKTVVPGSIAFTPSVAGLIMASVIVKNLLKH